MICWIASYPKSGNTYLRILISEYLFGDSSKEYDFSSLNQISQFPTLFHHTSLIENNVLSYEDLENEDLVLKNSISLQKKFFSKNFFFLKTHSGNFEDNNFKFTDKSITSCAIYIVRDPRNVLTSFSEYANESLEEMSNKMSSEIYVYQKSKFNKKWLPIYKLGSWKSNYLSWFRSQLEFPVKIVKYEDLVNNTYEVFIDILMFIQKYYFISIDSIKAKKVVELTAFSKLKDLEKHGLFQEMDHLKENIFFKEGINRNWKNDINNIYFKKLTSSFSEELNSLKYM